MSAVSWRVQSSPGAASRKASEKSILLVDSDADLRLMLGVLLAEEGYQVRSCGSLSEALEAIAGRRFDFIITAHSMPGIDGLRLLELIKQHDTAIPVLVISSRYEKEPYIIAMNLGALDYFTKPVDYGAIQRLIRSQA